MALLTLKFSFPGTPGNTIEPLWSHTGVVGSGDMEVLMEQKNQNGTVHAEVITPVRGFDYVWEKVLGDFVEENQVGDVDISINDNNATPFVAALRLKQAWIEAKGRKAQ